MRNIIRLATCETTMIEAAHAAAAGAPHGTAVVADEQTAGQARFGRRWHSEPGAGLYVSIVLRRQEAGLLTLALGLAAADATGVECDLRWPNDVLIGTKKVAGILVTRESGVFIAGIGMNVNHESFPPELAPVATSLRIETGRAQDRDAVLERLLDAIDRRLDEPDILGAFAARSSWVKGKRVIVDGRTRGVTDGLDSTGFLWLQQDDGVRRLVLTGGVREDN